MKASDVFVVLWVFAVSIGRAVKDGGFVAGEVRQIAGEAQQVAESIGDQLSTLDQPSKQRR